MLHWNDLHPYNAVLVARLPAPPDPARLGRVIDSLLAANGLTNLTLDRSPGTFHYAGGSSACEIKNLPSGENQHASLAAAIEAQLNIPFAHAGPFSPFRFFTFPEPHGFWLGVVYFHAIADAEAVALLMQEIVGAFLKPAGAPPAQPLNPHPRYRDGLFSHPGMWLRKLLSLPAVIRDLRGSSRRACRDADDLSNRFTWFTLDAGHVEALLKTAKAWEITLNDLFLALLLKCFSNLDSGRQRHPRRRKISVGGIANLRKDLGLAGQRVFGPFLGTFGVTHELPPDIGLRELAKDICRQTRVIKRGRLYLGSALELGFGRYIFSRSSPKHQKNFYSKNFPLWGGVTNVNLNAIWKQPPGEKMIDCLSAASTGPVIPLVFSVMTAGEIVNVALTWRPAFFSAADIDQIQKDFTGMVAGLKP